MNWKNLFSPGENISPGEVKTFIAEHQNDAYQLLDVRQAHEYEKGHLPGAILIPVKELSGRTNELDKTKPTFVY
jgi:rhodanese-related sulfurtransferase